MGVRSMAAAALTPLVPAEQLHAVCLHLADALPAAAGRDSAQRPGVPVSQNALHGSLLQLTALLSETSRGSSDSPSNAASCAALVQQLLPAFVQGGKVLAASSSTSCCAVRQAFVAAAGQLLVLAYRQWPLLLQPQQQHQPSVDVAPSAVGAGSSCVALLQQLVATLQASCLSAIQSTVPAASAGAEGAGSSVDQQDPLHSCWLRDCAALLLGPLLQLQLVLHKHAQHSTDAEVVAYQLQLLADVLPLTLTSSLYEVQAAALKAAAVQLQGVLAVCRQAHVSLSHSSSSSSAAAVRTLAACVWLALRQQQVVKVTKRLLVVWGHIQCLQQLLPDEQCVEGQQQQQQSGRYADSTGVEQLRVLLEMTEACREPEARAHALLGAARVTFELTARQQQRPAQGSAIYSSSSGSNSVDQGSGVGTGLPLDAVTRLLESFIAAHQPEHLRAAAAEALHLSGLLLPLAQGAAKHTAWSHLHTCGNTAAGTAASMDAPAQENELLPRACLDAWLLALRLMEDEDEDVRQAAAAAAQQALQLVPPALLQPLADMPAEQQQQQKQQELVGEAGGISSRSQAAAAAALAGAGAGAGAVSGLQYVAAVQCSCFALLGRCASWCPEVQPCLVQHLQQLVFPADTALPVVLQKHAHLQQQGGSGSSFVPVLPAVASGAVVQEEACVQHIQLPGVALRRLFEREADNHHEEQLLLAQHAAAALRHTLLMANPKGGCTQAQLGALLSGWCAGVVGGFLQVVAAGLTAQGCVGDVHHPEVFVPLYRCCLGLWAAAPSLSTAAAAAGQEGPSSWAQAVALLGQLSQLQLPKGLVQAVQAARDGEAVTAGSSGLLFLLQ
jgi:hypothetical protein